RGALVSVRRAIEAIRALDAAPLSQGLGEANAARCLRDACDDILAGLDRAIEGWTDPPRSVALVAAHGVFTSPLEWVALYAARGVPIHVKASARDPAFVEAMTRAFQNEGLAVSASTE